MSQIENLLALLEKGQDNALLHFGLGNAYLQKGDCDNACIHLQIASQHDPNYSAAWKLYGKALTQCEKHAEAIQAYEQGIRIAEENGDIQAAKEMKVFLKRLSK